MKRLLLVDDDAVVTRTYRDRLSAHGFQVATAASGTGALSLLASVKPDLVVLDLMMPEVSGVDVLKFIRGHRRLENTPVVVLANNIQDDLGRHAARLGIQKAFRKDQCSPTVLMAAIDEILEPSVLAAVRPTESEADLVMPADDLPLAAAVTAGDDIPQNSREANTGESTASFLAEAPAKCADLRDLAAALSRESLTLPDKQDLLQELFLKVRCLAETADLAGLAALAQATAAFDALLNALMDNPQRIDPSALWTVESLVELIGLLFQATHESGGGTPLMARVLVVNDDLIANEMVVAALDHAQLTASSIQDSVAAWQLINTEHFDLVLLKIDMPVLNGLQLCQCVRGVPGYETIPVILIASDEAPVAGSTSALIAADDLIAKPILPEELAARVLMRLVRTQMQPLGDRDPGSTGLADDRSDE